MRNNFLILSQIQTHFHVSSHLQIWTSCLNCGAGQLVSTSCSRGNGNTNTRCGMCTECSAGKFRPANLQTPGGCHFDGIVKVSNADYICTDCRDCGANTYRTGGCRTTTDSICSACTTCNPGKYRSSGCHPDTPTADAVCSQCSDCPTGKFRSGGCAGTTDSICVSCPSGRFAFGPTSTSCEGILIQDVHVKQFGDDAAKTPMWKPIEDGTMNAVEKTMYSEEAVISFAMPVSDSEWTEIRVYCAKGAGSDRCDTGGNGVATYTKRDASGAYYFVCSKDEIYQRQQRCVCNGVASFEASGSNEDCGIWGSDGKHRCLFQDGNCLDAAGEVPQRVMIGGATRWKGRCNPAYDLSQRPKCTSDPASTSGTRRVYVRMPGLQAAGAEFRFKILPKHSLAGYPPSDPSSWVRAIRLETQCGCVGSVGNGAPINPTIVQTWDGNKKGSEWELAFEDVSVCDAGVKVIESVQGGDDKMRYIPGVQATTQNCLPGNDRQVIISERQAVSITAGIGEVSSYCLQSSDQGTYNSQRACVNGAVQWAGRVTGLVRTTTNEPVVRAKVWLTAPGVWNGWERIQSMPLGHGFKTSIPSIVEARQGLPSNVPLEMCKERCINVTSCVALELRDDGTGCSFYGPWAPDLGSMFREGARGSSGTTSVPYAGFPAETYFEAKDGNPQVWVHRAMAVTGSAVAQNGQQTNFQINIMTDQITASAQTFTAHAIMFTGDFEHVMKPQTTQITVQHLSDTVAKLQEDFVDQSSNTVSGKVYFANTVTGSNPKPCGVRKATVSAHAVDAHGNAAEDALGAPVLTQHVGDKAGEYTISVPRETKFMIKVVYWNSAAASTCGNETWLSTCNPAGGGTSYTTHPSACGCQHKIALKDGLDKTLTLSSDIRDYDFVDTSVSQLKVEAYGGRCRFRLGGLRLRFHGEECTLYQKEVTINNGGIEASLQVPAIPFVVKWESDSITEERTGISSGDVNAKLGAAGPFQGQKRAPLSWGSKTVTFVYHPTPDMLVTMPNMYPTCSSWHNVLQQSKNYTAIIRVHESFGYVSNDASKAREVRPKV